VRYGYGMHPQPTDPLRSLGSQSQLYTVSFKISDIDLDIDEIFCDISKTLKLLYTDLSFCGKRPRDARNIQQLNFSLKTCKNISSLVLVCPGLSPFARYARNYNMDRHSGGSSLRYLYECESSSS
jgi:hypothetical protein